MSDTRPTQTWDDAADGWLSNEEIIERSTAGVERWLVEHLDPKPGEVFLDLAAGAGPMTIAIAKRVASGKVISTDASSKMLAGAEKRVRARGIDNVEFRVMDAEKIDLDTASVDGVLHRYGPMLLTDPDASFRGCKRVLRSGGRYAAAVWAAPQENPWVMLAGMPLMQRGHIQLADPTAPGAMFSLADPDVFRSKLETAGFSDVITDTVEHPQILKSFDELWKIPSEIAAPLATVIRGLPSDEIEAVKGALKDAAEPFRDGDGYRIPGSAVCVFAR